MTQTTCDSRIWMRLRNLIHLISVILILTKSVDWNLNDTRSKKHNGAIDKSQTSLPTHCILGINIYILWSVLVNDTHHHIIIIYWNSLIVKISLWATWLSVTPTIVNSRHMLLLSSDGHLCGFLFHSFTFHLAVWFKALWISDFVVFED